MKVLKIINNLISYIILENEKDKRVIVSFRGTATLDEWKLDLDFKMIDYIPFVVKDNMAKRPFNPLSSSVHRGFLTGYKSFHDETSQFVVDLMRSRGPEYQLYIIGHSLGGALAQLASLELSLTGLDSVLITYGSPKFAHSELTSWIESQLQTEEAIEKLGVGEFISNAHYRFTHLNDYVPLFPLFLQGYSHTGCEIEIKNPDSPVSQNDLEVIGKFTKSRENVMVNRKVKHLIKDYLLNPKKGYKEFMSSKFHRTYFTRIDCSVDIE